MPQVKIKHVISYSSQDPKFPVENLINGKGPWLCKHDDNSGILKAEFQLEKASKIEYIDVGNSNSAMFSIEVGQSTWGTSQPFEPLLPTVVLMSPAEFRVGKNAQTVRMFKKNDFNQTSCSQKWDKIRLICNNPFRKDQQYGLNFLRIFSQEETVSDEKFCLSPEMNKGKFLSQIRSNSPKVKMTSSLQSLETSILSSTADVDYENNSFKEVKSPISRAAKLIMARKHIPNQTDALHEKKELEFEALNYLVSLNLTSEDINNLKVSHIRGEFEAKRNKALTTREKLIFKNISLDFAAKRLKSLHEEKGAKRNEEKQTKNEDFIFKDTFCYDSRVTFDIWDNDTSPFKTSTEIQSLKNGSKSPLVNSKEKIKSVDSEFDQLDEIKDLINNRPISAKRQKLRNEEILTPRSSIGLDRNSLALEDCNVLTTPNQSAVKNKKLTNSQSNVKNKTPNQSSRKKRKIIEENSPSSSNLGKWLSPSDQKKNVNDDFTPQKCDDEIYISDASSDLECTPIGNESKSGENIESHFYTLGRKPSDKFGLGINSYIPNIGMQECPICSELFSTTEIEEHASECSLEYTLADIVKNSETTVSMEECPICGDFFDSTSLQQHAEECAETHFS